MRAKFKTKLEATLTMSDKELIWLRKQIKKPVKGAANQRMQKLFIAALEEDAEYTYLQPLPGSSNIPDGG